MSNPSLLVASTSTVKSFNAVRKYKRGHRFPSTILANWREIIRKQQKQRRRSINQYVMFYNIF
jgi:hypothetical protein